MKNLTTKITTLSSIAFAFLVNTTATFARWWTEDPNIAPDWSTRSDFQSWFMTVINYFLWFLWLIAMAIIVYAGFRMVISQWEEEEFNKARTQIIYAIVGLIVIILAYSIVRLVADIQV